MELEYRLLFITFCIVSSSEKQQSKNKNIKEGITSNNFKGRLWKCFDCYMRILTYFTTYLKASEIHLCKNESII